MMGKRMSWVVALMLGGGLVLGTLGQKVHGVPRETTPRPGFVVHEWGTFSTFSGSDGNFLKFHPNDRDLPGFVHSRKQYIKGGLPDVYLSLETPVLYFYTDRELNASVRVAFPKGRMTEWYPQASRPPDQGLVWDNIKIFPQGQAVSLKTEKQSRYYAARETDASPLQVAIGKDKQKTYQESEKFLFYRGVADFTMPLVVRGLGNGAFKVRNTGKDAIRGFVLVKIQGGKVRFQTSGALAPGGETSVQEPAEEATEAKLGEAVVQMLIQEGLYAKEARAMVKTWRSDWFGEEGTRVLYLVPPAQTDALLPLQVAPKPDALVRVLVGRHDVLTPERERDIDGVVRQLRGASNPEARAADETLNKLGRYRWAAQKAAEDRLKHLKDDGRKRG
jgi:hypothetical protein